VKRFTVHTDIFTRRSKFFAAARKLEWIAGDTAKSVDLSDEDPDVFQAYLNCVYVGSETLEETGGAFEREVRGSGSGYKSIWVYNICVNVTQQDLVTEFLGFGGMKSVNITDYGAIPRYESNRVARITFTTDEASEAALKFCDGLVLRGHKLAAKPCGIGLGGIEKTMMRRVELADIRYNTLIKLYLLADKLQDMATANMVMDKIEQFYKIAGVHPDKVPISTAYQSTVEGCPLRKWLHNIWFYDTNERSEKRFQENGFNNEFLHDVLKQYMRVKVTRPSKDSFSIIEANDGLDELECEIPIRCRYHQHDDEHRICPTTWIGGDYCQTCKAAKMA
jgi:hypothetical protein